MIEKINHYSLTTPASVYDEEALTALELAGRTASKTNEVVEAQNNLEKETTDHLKNQDDTIDKRLNGQDKRLDDFQSDVIPAVVEQNVQSKIDNGTFDEMIDRYAGDLTDRLDNLLNNTENGGTTSDAELVDARLDFTGSTSQNAGNAIRSMDKALHESIKMTQRHLLDVLNPNIERLDGSDIPILNGKIIYRPADNHSFGGTTTDLTGATYTDFIDVYEYPELFVTGDAQYHGCLVSLYDENQTYLGGYGYGVENEKVSFIQEYVNILDLQSINPRCRYIRCSSTYTALVIETPVKRDMVKYQSPREYEQHPLTVHPNGYISRNTGTQIPLNGVWQYTDMLKLSSFDHLLVSGNENENIGFICFYDEAKNYLGSLSGTSSLIESTSYTDFILYGDGSKYGFPTAKYVRFSSYSEPLTIKTPRVITLPDLCEDVSNLKLQIDRNNPLAGKKLVTCGDSFTAGDYTGYVDEWGRSGTKSDAFDQRTGTWRTWASFVVSNNNMELVNLAKCGMTMADSQENSFIRQRLYEQIPVDADYVLFQFGLNDQTSNTPLYGMWDDVVDAYGEGLFLPAFAIAVNWVMENRPKAKIGVIVSTGYLNSEYQEGLKDFCKLYGLPMFDFQNDPAIGCITNKTGVASHIRERYERLYMVNPESNQHPNLLAHERMGAMIGQWLKGM